MVMWIIIAAVALAGLIAAVIYVVNRIERFNFIDKIEDKTIYKNGRPEDRATANSIRQKILYDHKKKKISWLRRLIAWGIVVIVGVVLTLLLTFVEVAIILYHLAIFWLLCELVFFIIRLCGWDSNKLKVYLQGIITVSVTIIYLAIAAYLGTSVKPIYYDITTTKDVEPIRIVQIADSHLGVTLDEETFPEKVEQIKSLDPDIVLITGDFVDDSSSLEDMKASIQALSTIDCKYGVYFSYGNHDKGMMANDRGYTGADLEKEFENNGITVLEDEIIPLKGGYELIGRADASNNSRLSISDLISTLGSDETFYKNYSIVMDHQPNDYDEESAANVDLVLSGHTHGGQMRPINRIGEVIGANDWTYGHKKINNTDFIVTSGISSWSIRFKTGTRSEIVVIDINK